MNCGWGCIPKWFRNVAIPIFMVFCLSSIGNSFALMVKKLKKQSVQNDGNDEKLQSAAMALLFSAAIVYFTYAIMTPWINFKANQKVHQIVKFKLPMDEDITSDILGKKITVIKEFIIAKKWMDAPTMLLFRWIEILVSEARNTYTDVRTVKSITCVQNWLPPPISFNHSNIERLKEETMSLRFESLEIGDFVLEGVANNNPDAATIQARAVSINEAGEIRRLILQRVDEMDQEADIEDVDRKRTATENAVQRKNMFLKVGSGLFILTLAFFCCAMGMEYFFSLPRA